MIWAQLLRPESLPQKKRVLVAPREIRESTPLSASVRGPEARASEIIRTMSPWLRFGGTRLFQWMTFVVAALRLMRVPPLII